ncbi:MAG: hypothetical protein HKN19_04680 [Halioglobus sp.]|nr:hypothetical protein [Halioglobus sp.]
MFWRTAVVLLCAGSLALPVLPAAAGTWDEFKRIRQGESSLDKEEGEPAQPPAQPQQPPPQKPRKPSRNPAEANKAPKTPAVQPGAQNKPPAKKVAAARKAGPNPRLITAPDKPQETGAWWAFFRGDMKVRNNNWYDPHGVDFQWAYSRKKQMPAHPRAVVHMHGSGGGKGSMWVFGPSPKGDIEVRAQDAETYNADWREWWSYSADGVAYPGRRIAAALEFVSRRYNLDLSRRGLVLDGPSMGGGGAVIQTMILPAPWRELIAYSSARAGVVMPRQVRRRAPGQYVSQPPDNGRHKALWDSMDFELQSARDPIVRGIHYRHSFSSDDQFSRGQNGNTQLEFVNLVERHKIGGAFMWVKAGHASGERGVRMPDMANFEHKDQDVTLDRAHPAFTRSSGNYPRRMVERVDEEQFPRGHYNLGLIWNHAEIVDAPDQIVFPIRYQHRVNIGKGVPDQPKRITVNVTPRRPQQFQLQDGETLAWSWDDGALTGTAEVKGDTVTAKRIPLVSGQGYKNLRFYRP